MALYSFALAIVAILLAPWWGWKLLRAAGYREWLAARLRAVSPELQTYVQGKRVVWLHAVSVGETLAATRLVTELEAALGEGWRVVISTTTQTGQKLAKERFGAARVFYYPFDFATPVRAYLNALQPEALVLMESELWPRMLYECHQHRVPVVVANARVSDRSFARGVRFNWLWRWVIAGVTLWLAQTHEDAQRLILMTAPENRVKIAGNLKYDVRAPKQSRVAELIKEAAAGRPIVVAGSTVSRLRDKGLSEEELVIQAWEGAARRQCEALLVIAPRHPERFGEAAAVVMEFAYGLASDWMADDAMTPPFAKNAKDGPPNFVPGRRGQLEVVLLDTIGDLGAVYGVADVAFVGGSLVKRGGHNPLEPAQFGAPVVMGPSFENFRDVVERLVAADGISIVGGDAGLSAAAQKRASGRDDNFEVKWKSELKDEFEAELVRLLTDRDAARAMGERGRRVFEEQQGATARVVAAIVAMVQP